MHQDCCAKNEIIKIRMENASIISITYETPRRFKKILQYSTELFANIRFTFANKRIFYAKMTPNFRQKKNPRIILGIIHASKNLVSFNLCPIMNTERFDENCFLLTYICSPSKIFQKCSLCNFYRQIRYSANFVQIKIV